MQVSVIGLSSWGFSWFETGLGFMWRYGSVMFVPDGVNGEYWREETVRGEVM